MFFKQCVIVYICTALCINKQQLTLYVLNWSELYTGSDITFARLVRGGVAQWVRAPSKAPAVSLSKKLYP